MVSAQFYTWLSCTDICHARCSDVRRVTGMQVGGTNEKMGELVQRYH